VSPGQLVVPFVCRVGMGDVRPGSRFTEPSVIPVSHFWKIVCCEQDLRVDEQIVRVLHRLRSYAGRVAELAGRLAADGGVTVLQGVRYFNGTGQDRSDASATASLFGWHLDRNVLVFLTAVGAEFDVDEYDMVALSTRMSVGQSRWAGCRMVCLRMSPWTWDGPDVAVTLGDKYRFAAEVGEGDHALRRVDLWAAGQWLTCDDNMAFVEQFRRAVLDTAAWLRSGGGSPLPFAGLSPEAVHRRLVLGVTVCDETEADYELRSRFRVLNWGPTTDNVTILLFRDGDRLVLTLQFWREEHLLKHPEHAGEVFVARVPAGEFVGILDGLLAALDESQHERLPVGD